MKTIFKYPLEFTGEQIIESYSYFTPLTVQMQGNEITIWAMVEDESTTDKYKIRIIGTGRRMPKDIDSYVYYGTVQRESFVWHVFGKRV